MNMFRIPLNVFVCVILYNVSSFPLSLMFAMCASFLVMAAVAQRNLDLLTARPPPPHPRRTSHTRPPACARCAQDCSADPHMSRLRAVQDLR